MSSRAVCSTAAIVVAGFVAPSFADRATSDQLAADAAKLAASGDLAGAASTFRAAFAADPRPELVCNVGVAYYKLADLPRADRYLNECIATGGALDTAFLTRVRTALDSVESGLLAHALAPIDLDVSPATAIVVVDAWPDEPLVGAHRVWVAYGHHNITVRAPDYAAQTIELDVTSHAPIVRRVVLAPNVAAPPPISIIAPPTTPATSAPAPSSSPRLAEGLLVTGGVLALAGVGLHVATEVERSDLQTTGTSWDDHVGAFEHVRDATIACYALAAITGGLGGYLLYRHHGEHGPTLGAAIAPGMAAIAVEWQR
ncbi:MAG TPA: hypothetical protein VGG28_29510 [Kofleriaceae bacterium]